MESKKYKKLLNIIKKKETPRSRHPGYGKGHNLLSLKRNRVGIHCSPPHPLPWSLGANYCTCSQACDITRFGQEPGKT